MEFRDGFKNASAICYLILSFHSRSPIRSFRWTLNAPFKKTISYWASFTCWSTAFVSLTWLGRFFLFCPQTFFTIPPLLPLPQSLLRLPLDFSQYQLLALQLVLQYFGRSSLLKWVSACQDTVGSVVQRKKKRILITARTMLTQRSKCNQVLSKT